ncbi:hypothetical protein J6K67_08920, partial [Leuconostoc mesenteroides]|uniref:hypothetical protein n=2 Tax=Leuconostoc mesenteroides TaxID=1245 RepID=UPI001CBC68C9
LLLCNHKLTYKLMIIWLSYFVFFLVPFTILNNLNYPIGIFFIVQFSLLPGMIFYFQFCLENNNPWSLLIKIDRIIYIVAIISLICWFMFSILKLVNPTSYVYTDWGALRAIPSFYGIYFETQPVSVYGISIVRNTAFFTEGPMYAFVLSISFIFKMFLFKKNIREIIVIIFAMLSTITSTTLIIIILVVFFKYLKNSKNHLVNTFKYALLPIFIIIFLITIVVVLEKKSQGGESFGIRVDDIHAALLTWLKHPFIGSGIGNFESLIADMNTTRTQFKTPIEIGFSSGLFQVLALGGLPLTFVYVYPIVAFAIRQHSKRGVYALAFSSIVIVIFITSIVTYEWLFMILLIMLYVNSLRETDTYANGISNSHV